MNIFYRLRARTSEIFRIRNGFGIWPIRNLREATALYNFCMNEINNRPVRERKLNPERFQIYKEYCRLYRWTLGVRKQPIVERGGKSYINMYDFARDFAGWFWS